MASVKGFGPGPYEECKVYENIAQCAGGAASTTGFRRRPAARHRRADRRFRNRAASRAGHRIGSCISAIAPAAVSACCAPCRTACSISARVKLRDQQRLKHGPLTEYSQFGEGIPFGQAVPRAGNDSGGGQPAWLLKCKGWETDPDAYIYFITQAPVWAEICDLIGKPEWKTDPDFATPPARLPRLKYIFGIIEEWTMTKTKFEVMDICNQYDIPVGPILSMKEFAEEQSLARRGTVVEVDHPRTGQISDGRKSDQAVGFALRRAALAAAWASTPTRSSPKCSAIPTAELADIKTSGAITPPEKPPPKRHSVIIDPPPWGRSDAKHFWGGEQGIALRPSGTLPGAEDKEYRGEKHAHRCSWAAGFRESGARSAYETRRQRGWGVCRARETGPKIDPLKEAALAAGIPVFQPPPTASKKFGMNFVRLKPDLQVMAFVTLFVPSDFLNIPTHGSIQYHPSLLPKGRGASAINWPIMQGEAETGLSIFWPDDGLDTGDVLLQKTTPISDTDTLGSVYFDRLFPMGVEAMMEAVDLVKAGKAPRIKQDEALATYEGRCGEDNARIDWGKPWRQIDRTIRGCNPSPGAWTTIDGKILQVFEAKPLPAKDPKGYCRQDRRSRRYRRRWIFRRLRRWPDRVLRVSPADGGKVAAADFAKSTNLATGTRLS